MSSPGYPFPGAQVPTYDLYGQQIQVTPTVTKSTAGNLGPGQTLVSACGRISTSTSAAVTVPLFVVPANKTWFETDFNLSTVATVEVDCQVQAGAVPIDRAVTTSTSPFNALHETQPFAPGGSVVSLVLPQTTTAYNIDFYVAGYMQAQPPY